MYQISHVTPPSRKIIPHLPLIFGVLNKFNNKKPKRNEKFPFIRLNNPMETNNICSTIKEGFFAE
jgi:hypothetical protein